MTMDGHMPVRVVMSVVGAGIGHTAMLYYNISTVHRHYPGAYTKSQQL